MFSNKSNPNLGIINKILLRHALLS